MKQNQTDSRLSSLRPDPAKLFARATVTAAAAAVLIPGAAQAQSSSAQSAEAEGEVTTLSEVVITAKTDSYKPELLQSPTYTAPLLDVPQTVSVVPESLIKAQGATTMREVLRNVPGISMQAGEGPLPTADSLTIRGFSASGDIYVDGIRDVGGYARDPFNVEQVEVSKGPSSIMGGRGTTGGTVNIVSKTPKLDRFYSGEIGFGTDQYKRFTLDLNQPLNVLGLEGGAFRINALWTDYDVARRDWVNNNRWALAPSIAFGLGTDTRITLSYFHQQENGRPDYGIPFVPSDNPNRPLVPELRGHAEGMAPTGINTWYGLKKRDFLKTVADRVTLDFEHDFSEDFTLRNTFRYGRTRHNSLVSAPRFVDPSVSTDVLRNAKPQDQTNWLIADSMDFTVKFDTFGWKHTANLGIEYTHENTKNSEYAAVPGTNSNPTSLTHPNSEDFPTNRFFPNGYSQATANTIALYFGETIEFHEKFEITGGVRYERFDIDYERVRPNQAQNLYLSRVDNMVSWQVAPVFKPVPFGSIYISYGTSFNPSGEGMALTPDTVNISPEEARTIELGTKWDLLDKRLSVNASIFRVEKRNTRTPGLLPSDPAVVLEGKQRVDGFEVGIAGAITRNWQVYGGYSYLESEIVSSNRPQEIGKRLPNTPQQTFSLWTSYELPWNITIGGGAQYVGSRFSNPSSEPIANQRKAPDYWLFDAMVSYKITENVTARLNVYNLFDEKYADRAAGQHYVPGAGRSGTLTLAFNF